MTPPKLTRLKSMIALSDNARITRPRRAYSNDLVDDRIYPIKEEDGDQLDRTPPLLYGKAQLATPMKICNFAAGSVKIVHSRSRGRMAKDPSRLRETIRRVEPTGT
ncbi:hypothetical protein AAE478_006221 [Parahypoxylon ruwenzoriense]